MKKNHRRVRRPAVRPASAREASTTEAAQRTQPDTMIIDRRTTYDCAPTLTDDDVLQFCKTGFLCLPAVVPEAVNTRCRAFLEEHAAADHSAVEAAGAVDGKVRIGRVAEPMELLGEDWFVEGVLCCSAVVGAVRSLLGPDLGLPILVSNHRMTPTTTPAAEQAWHHDGGSQFNGTELHYLQVFYYPAECTPEMGPTELCSGENLHDTSHFSCTSLYLERRWDCARGCALTEPFAPGTHWGECQGYPPVAAGPLREPVGLSQATQCLSNGFRSSLAYA